MIESVIQLCANVAELDRGGQKVVYAATHPTFGEVVLKVGTYPHPKALERIAREVSLLADIDSPYYPKHRLFVVDAANKRFLIVEDKVAGTPLAGVMAEFRTENDVIQLLKHLIDALDILWQQRVVHRDVKPQNIIIKPDRVPVVIDLGIARLLDLSSLTLPGAPVGPCTAAHASPEQLQNKKLIIDTRADFYALGLLSLQLRLGAHPFDPALVGDGESIPDNILNGRFVRPESIQETSPAFARLIYRLLQHEPHNRFKNRERLSAFIAENWGRD